MPTVDELLSKTPIEVLQIAEQYNYSTAVKRSSLENDPNIIELWYKKHPEFFDPGVRELQRHGETIVMQGILEQVRGMGVTVISIFSDQGATKRNFAFASPIGIEPISEV